MPRAKAAPRLPIKIDQVGQPIRYAQDWDAAEQSIRDAAGRVAICTEMPDGEIRAWARGRWHVKPKRVLVPADAQRGYWWDRD